MNKNEIPKHPKLKRNKETVFKALGIMLKCYENYRKILKLSDRAAVKKTLKTYDDFYEWLTGKTGGVGE